MAKNETATETAPVAAPAAEEAMFPLEKLRAKCLHLFGVTTSTFDGATRGMTGDHSIDKIKNALKTWGEKEVK